MRDVHARWCWRRLAWLACAVALGVSWNAAPVRAQAPLPPLAGRVVDAAHVLSPGQSAALKDAIRALEASKGVQLGVVTVESTAPETIEQYSIRLAEQWKLGRKGVDDGVILVVAVKDRRLRIEVGYGLEGALPDVTAKRIIEERVVPRFKAKDLPGGIAAGVAAIAQVVGGEPLPHPKQAGGGFVPGYPSSYVGWMLSQPGWAQILGLLALVAVGIVVLIGCGWLMYMLLGFPVGALVFAAAAAGYGWHALGHWIGGLMGGAFLGVPVLMVGVQMNFRRIWADPVLRARYKERLAKAGFSPDDFTASGWRSSSGGFSSGGGSFGGGGASGSW